MAKAEAVGFDVAVAVGVAVGVFYFALIFCLPQMERTPYAHFLLPIPLSARKSKTRHERSAGAIKRERPRTHRRRRRRLQEGKDLKNLRVVRSRTIDDDRKKTLSRRPRPRPAANASLSSRRTLSPPCSRAFLLLLLQFLKKKKRERDSPG